MIRNEFEPKPNLDGIPIAQIRRMHIQHDGNVSSDYWITVTGGEIALFFADPSRGPSITNTFSAVREIREGNVKSIIHVANTGEVIIIENNQRAILPKAKPDNPSSHFHGKTFTNPACDERTEFAVVSANSKKDLAKAWRLFRINSLALKSHA